MPLGLPWSAQIPVTPAQLNWLGLDLKEQSRTTWPVFLGCVTWRLAAVLDRKAIKETMVEREELAEEAMKAGFNPRIWRGPKKVSPTCF